MPIPQGIDYEKFGKLDAFQLSDRFFYYLVVA